MIFLQRAALKTRHHQGHYKSYYFFKHYFYAIALYEQSLQQFLGLANKSLFSTSLKLVRISTVMRPIFSILRHLLCCCTLPALSLAFFNLHNNLCFCRLFRVSFKSVFYFRKPSMCFSLSVFFSPYNRFSCLRSCQQPSQYFSLVWLRRLFDICGDGHSRWPRATWYFIHLRLRQYSRIIFFTGSFCLIVHSVFFNCTSLFWSITAYSLLCAIYFFTASASSWLFSLFSASYVYHFMLFTNFVMLVSNLLMSSVRSVIFCSSMSLGNFTWSHRLRFCHFGMPCLVRHLAHFSSLPTS